MAFCLQSEGVSTEHCSDSQSLSSVCLFLYFSEAFAVWMVLTFFFLKKLDLFI